MIHARGAWRRAMDSSPGRALGFVGLAVVVATAALAGSQAARQRDDSVAANAEQAALGDWGDGVWMLHVDRAWDGSGGGIGFPTDPLDETDYLPVAFGPSYVVTVTAGAGAIAIGSPPITGTLGSAGADLIRYDLLGGTFAGGRTPRR